MAFSLTIEGIEGRRKNRRRFQSSVEADFPSSTIPFEGSGIPSTELACSFDRAWVFPSIEPVVPSTNFRCSFDPSVFLRILQWSKTPSQSKRISLHTHERNHVGDV